MPAPIVITSLCTMSALRRHPIHALRQPHNQPPKSEVNGTLGPQPLGGFASGPSLAFWTCRLTLGRRDRPAVPEWEEA